MVNTILIEEIIMKINNEFLINTFSETQKNKTDTKNSEGFGIENKQSFSAVLNQSLMDKVIQEGKEVTNGDTFRKEITNNNTFEGGGWTYVDKYGFSHVVSDYKTADRFKMPGTEVYQYNGRYGGGYALDPDNNRQRVSIPEEKPFGNDLSLEPEQRAKIADTKHIGKAFSYTQYLEMMTRLLDKAL